MAEQPDLVIVIGASAGGLEPLKRLLSTLPRSIPATVLVVVHASRTADSHLAAILAGVGELPAAFPRDKTPVRSGNVYVAPANRHMAVEDSRVRVLPGPQENGQRSAIDVLFRSAAEAYGRRVIGIVLSGTLDDGAAGLRAIKRRGGITVVQSPEDADFPDMPEAAIREGAADYILPLDMIPRALLGLIRGKGDERRPWQSPSGTPPNESRLESPPFETAPPGKPSPQMPRMSPPPVPSKPTESSESTFARSTRGSVLQGGGVKDATVMRLRRSRILPQAKAEENARTVDRAMWTALRLVRERVVVLRRMANYVRQRGKQDLADHYEADAEEAGRAADVMRDLLFPG